MMALNVQTESRPGKNETEGKAEHRNDCRMTQTETVQCLTAVALLSMCSDDNDH